MKDQGLVTNQGTHDVEVNLTRNGGDLEQRDGGKWVLTKLGAAVAEHIVRYNMKIQGYIPEGSFAKWRKELP